MHQHSNLPVSSDNRHPPIIFRQFGLRNWSRASVLGVVHVSCGPCIMSLISALLYDSHVTFHCK